MQNESSFASMGIKVITSSVPIKPPQFATMKSENYLLNVVSNLNPIYTNFPVLKYFPRLGLSNIHHAWFVNSLQEKRSITTEKIVAITTKSLQLGVIATKFFFESHCNKLRGNRFIQQKNLVVINPKHCNEQVDAITSLLQQITIFYFGRPR